MAHIRAMRGTVSALAADADEFGAMRTLSPGSASARGGRRRKAGARILQGISGTDVANRVSGGRGLRGRKTPAQPARLDFSGFLTSVIDHLIEQPNTGRTLTLNRTTSQDVFAYFWLQTR